MGEEQMPLSRVDVERLVGGQDLPQPATGDARAMTIEMTPAEAEILIACLTFAEGAALVESPAMVEALRVLRPWRSALLQTYLRERINHATQ